MTYKFNGLAHHVGEACGQPRMFKRLNGASQRCEIGWCECHNP